MTDAESERKAIVAWLRATALDKQAEAFDSEDDEENNDLIRDYLTLHAAANSIERLAHLNPETSND